MRLTSPTLRWGATAAALAVLLSCDPPRSAGGGAVDPVTEAAVEAPASPPPTAPPGSDDGTPPAEGPAPGSPGGDLARWGDSWEDILLPQCRRVFEGQVPTAGVYWERRSKMTDNHEAARLCVAFGAALRDPEHRARRASVVAEVRTWLEGQRQEHMYGEQLSDYWPFWALSVAGILNAAEAEGEPGIAALARDWFRADTALNLQLAAAGRVVAPGCRVKAVIYNPPRDMALAWLTGAELRPELAKMVARGDRWFEQRAGGRPFDRWGAWAVRRLLDRGLLEPWPGLGPDDLPGLRWPLEIRKHAHGHEAWSPYLECATRPRWAVAVDDRAPEEPLLVQGARGSGGGPRPPWPEARRRMTLGEPLRAVAIAGVRSPAPGANG